MNANEPAEKCENVVRVRVKLEWAIHKLYILFLRIGYTVDTEWVGGMSATNPSIVICKGGGLK